MNTPQAIALLSRKLQVTDSSLTLEDADLLVAIEDARAFLDAKSVKNMSDYVIDVTDTTDGIQPNMTSQHALIVCTQAAVQLLQQRYAELTQAGALGIVWRSGLEEESTVTLERAYRGAITALSRELDTLILSQNRHTSATRAT